MILRRFWKLISNLIVKVILLSVDALKGHTGGSNLILSAKRINTVK